MTDAADQSVLRRMVSTSKAPAPAAVPLTAARAVRLAMSRAAENFVGLKVKVLSVSEDTLALDGVVAALSDDLLMSRLKKSGAEVGVIAFDQNIVAAFIEMQTTGLLADKVPNARPITLVDATLIEPLGIGFLSELLKSSLGTTLAGWVDDIEAGSRFQTCWDIGLKLATGGYRLMRVDLGLGATEREGSIWIGLPAPGIQAPEVIKSEPQPDWHTTFENAIMESPAVLNAILHRFDLPLDKINRFEIGQVVPLTGCTVGSVKLEGSDGKLITKARLGQSGGYVAVRVQTPAPQMLDELTAPRTVAAITVQEPV